MSLSSTNGDPGGSSGLPEVSGLQSVAKPEIFSLSEPDHTKIHSYNLIELHILFICIGKKSHKILVCILE